MKLKIGQKLQTIREERKMTQIEFAELLEVSLSQYARIERGETQVPFDQLSKFSEALNIPIHEFLPDTITLYNNQHGQGGNIFGTYNYYANPDARNIALEHENEKLKQKIQMQTEMIETLKNLIDKLSIKE